MKKNKGDIRDIPDVQIHTLLLGEFFEAEERNQVLPTKWQSVASTDRAA